MEIGVEIRLVELAGHLQLYLDTVFKNGNVLVTSSRASESRIHN
jgi:hypothetical protein